MFFNKTNRILMFATLSLYSSVWAEGVYWQEFLAVKASPAYDMMFDEEISPIVQNTVRCIENGKRAEPGSLAIRPVISTLECIIIDETNMPLLYDYVCRLSAQHNIAMPVVAIMPRKGFFNAAGEKYLVSSGTIAIGRDLLKECTQEEVEAVIAHEMGHIKYDHVNKMLALDVVRIAILSYLYKQEVLGGWNCILLQLLVPYLLVGKKFEWQADDFACREAGKAKGVIKFFERMKTKDVKLDTDLDKLRVHLIATDSELSETQEIKVWNQYIGAKWYISFIHGLMWLYHHTPLGAHPSNDLRLQNARRIDEEQGQTL